MRVSADIGKCVGAGNCVMNAESVFDQDDATGKVVVLDEAPPESARGDIQAAVRECPSGAVRLEG
jgi:ferredoxin